MVYALETFHCMLSMSLFGLCIMKYRTSKNSKMVTYDMTIILEPDSVPDSKLGPIQQQKAIIQLSKSKSILSKFCQLNKDEMYFILV